MTRRGSPRNNSYFARRPLPVTEEEIAASALGYQSLGFTKLLLVNLGQLGRDHDLGRGGEVHLIGASP